MLNLERYVAANSVVRCVIVFPASFHFVHLYRAFLVVAGKRITLNSCIASLNFSPRAAWPCMLVYW